MGPGQAADAAFRDDTQMRAALLLLALFTAASAEAAARSRLSEPQVRAFVQRQSQAWNAGDLDRYFALFTPEAAFTDQGRARDGRVVPYGTSTLAQARTQTRRSRAGAKVSEATTIRGIVLTADGRSARVTSAEDTRIATAGRARRLCAERVQTIVVTPGGLRSTGQTDTYVRCR